MLPRKLLDRLSGHENVIELARRTLDAWPDHASFIEKSLGGHQDSDYALLERLSTHIMTLAGDGLPQFIESYRWLCATFNEEQIHFVRHKKYRRSSFAEVNAAVYSNKEFMQKYMEGLLVSQLFWQNHAKSYIFHSNFVDSLQPGYRYLEIGPGHGLYLATVASQSACAAAEAWDISSESLAQTESSIRKIGVAQPVKLLQRDVQTVSPDEAKSRFDVIVISEVLEHLEHPDAVLANLKSFLAANGKLMINFPINSPAPDHIFLLESLEAVVAFVQAAGLKVQTAIGFPSTGYTLERAKAVGATVSCAIIATQ